MRQATLINGIVVGIVSSLEDPENLARVQVRYAFLGQQVSQWAKLVSLSAGNDRGTLFRPEPEDEVLLAFEMGDPNRPYVLGGLWNLKDKPPPMGDPSKENNWRVIKSRSGHVLKFNDKKGAETIEVRDMEDKRTIVIDTPNKKIEVVCDGDDGTVSVKVPDGSVEIDAKRKIAVTCEAGDVAVAAKGGGKVTVQSETSDVEVTASAGSVKVSAAQVEVSADTTMKLKAGASMDIEASGILNIKGSLVNIN